VTCDFRRRRKWWKGGPGKRTSLVHFGHARAGILKVFAGEHPTTARIANQLAMNHVKPRVHRIRLGRRQKLERRTAQWV